jgi:hypothetical protein
MGLFIWKEAPMTPFAFGIPLRSQEVAKDWPATVRLFQNTLKSILGQRDPEFRIFVACHEVPSLDEITDPHVEVLEADWVPRRGAAIADKRSKHRMIAGRWGELGAGYLMFVDADDLVSRSIVSYIHAHGDWARGFAVQRGYELDARTGRIAAAPRFHRLCGSSIIVNWRRSELPRDTADEEGLYLAQQYPYGQLFPQVLDVGHARTVDLFAARRQALRPLPFPAAIYVRNHGDNVSAVLGTDGWRRSILRALTPAHELTQELREEFGIIDWPPDEGRISRRPISPASTQRPRAF